jgi:hypothetical protein
MDPTYGQPRSQHKRCIKYDSIALNCRSIGLLQVVPFIVSQSMVALSQTGPATTGTSRETCGDQGHYKWNTVYQTSRRAALREHCLVI